MHGVATLTVQSTEGQRLDMQAFALKQRLQ